MSETTDAVAGHAPNLFARWIVDNFPRFQVSCECGWKSAAEDSEQAATASHAEHARQPIGSPTWNPMSQSYDRPPTLAAFLLARIDEEGKGATLAVEAAPAPWEAADRGWMASLYCEGSDERMIVLEQDAVPGRKTPGDVLHFVARHDPARVLAECEAKRRIVDLADEATGLDMQVDSEFRVGSRDDAAEPYLGDLMLRALAEPYADHPDYSPEWRP